MAWTEHQQAVLRAMGLRVWGPAATEAVLAGSEVPADVAASTMPEPQAAHPAPPPALRQAPMPASGAVPDVATLDWPALRAAVADCRACSLCQTRRQTVFGIGSPSAHWMVVGEAPGEHEDRQGEPFVGAAGQLLDRMLAALDLTRDSQGDDPARQVYIANTLKCRPPGNRNPAPEELARCEPFLQRQIALVQPRIILAMGRFAVQSLLRSDAPIGKLRGQVHQYQGVPLVVTYHPAYLLRNLPDKAKAWADLCLAAETAGAAPRPV
jgi:uracil-DNA glycosylase family 4